MATRRQKAAWCYIVLILSHIPLGFAERLSYSESGFDSSRSEQKLLKFKASVVVTKKDTRTSKKSMGTICSGVASVFELIGSNRTEGRAVLSLVGGKTRINFHSTTELSIGGYPQTRDKVQAKTLAKNTAVELEFSDWNVKLCWPQGEKQVSVTDYSSDGAVDFDTEDMLGFFRHLQFKLQLALTLVYGPECLWTGQCLDPCSKTPVQNLRMNARYITIEEAPECFPRAFCQKSGMTCMPVVGTNEMAKAFQHSHEETMSNMQLLQRIFRNNNNNLEQCKNCIAFLQQELSHLRWLQQANQTFLDKERFFLQGNESSVRDMRIFIDILKNHKYIVNVLNGFVESDMMKSLKEASKIGILPSSSGLLQEGEEKGQEEKTAGLVAVRQHSSSEEAGNGSSLTEVLSMTAGAMATTGPVAIILTIMAWTIAISGVSWVLMEMVGERSDFYFLFWGVHKLFFALFMVECAVFIAVAAHWGWLLPGGAAARGFLKCATHC
mmetsp:Transcript_126495/g.252751  ORF Transcript_126495/g.252751 Transcript_126495/m.252751 type:complete len:495 (-) Transcript_126495:262-1746(-)